MLSLKKREQTHLPRAIVILAILVAVTLAASAALAHPGARAAAKQLDTLNWSFDQVAQNLDPIKAGDLSSESAISNSAEGLVVYSPTGVIQPDLATSWKHSDAKTYVFQIRQRVKFWDGTQMTMADVLYWMNRIMHNPSSIFVSYFADVNSVKQTGPWQLTIRLKHPNPTFLGLAVFLFVGEKKYTQAHEKDLGTPSALGMFTGPYILSSYTPQESVTLKRWDGYWGRKGSAATINYKFIPDDQTRQLALRSGQIDGGFDVPAASLPAWHRISNAHVITKPNLQFGYVSMDVKQAPWSDRHVRRAIAYATDRVGIVKAILRGNATPATSYPPPQDWAGLLTASQVARLYRSLPNYPFSLKKAKAELAKSSVPNGFKATINVPAAPPELQKIALTLSANLKQIGITLSVKQVSSAQYMAAWYTNKKNTGIQVIENGPTVQDPQDFPGIMLTKRYNVSGGFNTANYVNPRIEALWAKQLALTKPKARIQPIVQVLRIGQTDSPYVPMFWNKGSVAVSNKLVYNGFHAAWYVIQPWALYIKPA